MGPAGSPIFRGISSGTPPVLQPGSRFTDRTYGLDEGHRKFLVHPDRSKTSWPQKGDQDAEHPSMFVVEVTPSDDPSSMVELDVVYRGISGKKPKRVTPDCDTRMITIPSSASTATNNLQFPLPIPTVCTEFVVTAAPNLNGVGLPIAAEYLPSPASISLEFVPDPDNLPSVNYWGNQWVLDGRTWEEIIPGKVWFVRERMTYYYRISA